MKSLISTRRTVLAERLVSGGGAGEETARPDREYIDIAVIRFPENLQLYRYQRTGIDRRRPRALCGQAVTAPGSRHHHIARNKEHGGRSRVAPENRDGGGRS